MFLLIQSREEDGGYIPYWSISIEGPGFVYDTKEKSGILAALIGFLQIMMDLFVFWQRMCSTCIDGDAVIQRDYVDFGKLMYLALMVEDRTLMIDYW